MPELLLADGLKRRGARGAVSARALVTLDATIKWRRRPRDGCPNDVAGDSEAYRQLEASKSNGGYPPRSDALLHLAKRIHAQKTPFS